MNKISVALIEDHHLTRAGIKAALEDCEELEFIGEAVNGLQGITLLEKTRPDVIGDKLRLKASCQGDFRR